MAKPVDNIEFWKERIQTAPVEHYSVFVTDEKEWRHIEETHKKIIGEHINGSVLDAGCGYGRASEWFSEYLGIDFSPDFILKAKEKYPNKSFEVQDLKNLPYPDQSFDWAFCISIKRMIQDNLGLEVWNKMEQELKRVAKKVLILEYGECEKYEIL